MPIARLQRSGPLDCALPYCTLPATVVAGRVNRLDLGIYEKNRLGNIIDFACEREVPIYFIKGDFNPADRGSRSGNVIMNAEEINDGMEFLNNKMVFFPTVPKQEMSSLNL